MPTNELLQYTRAPTSVAFDAFAFTGWSEEQKKIVVKLAFLATFAVMFYATMAVIFAHVWIGMAKAIGVRVLWGVGVSIGLAMAPPVFPNAAAHALALVRMAAEVVIHRRLCLRGQKNLRSRLVRLTRVKCSSHGAAS